MLMVSLCMASLYLKHHYTSLKVLTFFRLSVSPEGQIIGRCTNSTLLFAFILMEKHFFRLWLFTDLEFRCFDGFVVFAHFAYLSFWSIASSGAVYSTTLDKQKRQYQMFWDQDCFV